ncbi:MAG: F0F1 ATP synthase subunit B [Cyanobacteria bacterium P01_A01_bin.135]
MGTLFLLAVEAGAIGAEAAGEHHGFALNFDPLETNLINLVIIIGVLIYFGRGFLGSSLAERRSRIESEIREAEQRKQDAAANLAEEQQKLAQAQTEAARLLKEAEGRAETARQAVLDQSEKDIERLRAAAVQDTTSQRDRMVAELRQRVTEMALQRTEERLRSEVDDSTQQRLVDKSITMLGG